MLPREILFGHHQFNTVGGRRYQTEFPLDEYGSSPIDHLQAGDLLLVRAINHCSTQANFIIDYFPLYDDVYFVNVNDENAMAAAWAAMENDIAILEANTHMLMLTGTKDMTALPLVHSGTVERFTGRFLNYDDYLNANPVIVVPVNLERARRDINIGDTITLTLRDMRTFTDGAAMTPELRQFTRDMVHLISPWRGHGPPPPHVVSWAVPEGVETLWSNMPAGYWVSIPRDYEGDWQNYPTIEIDVEIVGAYRVREAMALPRWQHIAATFQNMEAFVPASIIPEGWGIVDAHIVSGAYSFVLASPDYVVPFNETFGSALESLGFAVQFMSPDATNFLASATPIRNSIQLNLILFSSVLAVVTLLTVFLYLRQRYKEFAILRALGIAEKNSVWQVVVPVLVFWVPIVIIASVGAWFFALNQATIGLRVLAEIITPLDYSEPLVVMNILERMRFDEEIQIMRATPQLSILYLFLLCTALIAVWLTTVLGGTVSFARRSMISLLQGTGGAPARAIKETEPHANLKIENIDAALKIMPVRVTGGAARSVLRHHRRHILRAPVKSLLVFGMALLFVISLGWLNVTIHFTEGEIERLYATTEIKGQIVSPVAVVEGALRGHGIPWSSIERLINSGYVTDVFHTSLSEHGLFPAIGHENINEEQLEEASTGNCCCWRSDIVKTISDWSLFVREASRPLEFGLGVGNEFSYTFAEGFGPEDFVFTPPIMGERIQYIDIPDGTTLEVVVSVEIERTPIPVIDHESLLARDMLLGRGIGLLETNVTLFVLDNEGNNTLYTLSPGDQAILSNQVDFTPVIIIGTYKGGHPLTAYHMNRSLIMAPHGAYWSDIGGGIDGSISYEDAWYSSVTFKLHQDMVRYVREINEELNELLTYTLHYEWFCTWRNLMQHETTFISHNAELDDAEFRLVVIPLEDNLHLLRILYPVAIVTSFVLALGLSLLLMLQNAKNVANYVFWAAQNTKHALTFLWNKPRFVY